MLTSFTDFLVDRQDRMSAVTEFVGNIPGVDQERVATTFPVELRGVPPEIMKLNDAFKNKNLNVTQHDMKRPAEVDPTTVGPEFANLDPAYRSKIKMTGHKLYIIGDALKKFLHGYFHSNDYMGLPKPMEAVELVTTAHPELVKLIIKQAIQDHILPDGVTVDNTKEAQGTLIVRFPANAKLPGVPSTDGNGVEQEQKGGLTSFKDSSAGKKSSGGDKEGGEGGAGGGKITLGKAGEYKTFSITTCKKHAMGDPLMPTKKAGRVQFGTLEDDAEMRGPEEALYYDIDKKSIMDYGHGIYNIRKNPKMYGPDGAPAMPKKKAGGDKVKGAKVNPSSLDKAKGHKEGGSGGLDWKVPGKGGDKPAKKKGGFGGGDKPAKKSPFGGGDKKKSFGGSDKKKSPFGGGDKKKSPFGGKGKKDK